MNTTLRRWPGVWSALMLALWLCAGAEASAQSEEVAPTTALKLRSQPV
jgi:hypothetical protein